MNTEKSKKRMQIALFACLMLILSFSLEGTIDSDIDDTLGLKWNQDSPQLRIHGVKIFVGDLNKSMEFYTKFLGLKEDTRDQKKAVLNTGQYPLYLIQSNIQAPRDLHVESHYGISFLTYKLLPAIDAARASGYTIFDTLLSRNGIGIHIPIEDPSGNLLHLMEVQVRDIPRFEGYRLYNSGTTVGNMTESEEFYTGMLGFSDWSRDYLPDALPLKHQDGSFAFMLHENNKLRPSTYMYGAYPGNMLMLETNDLKVFAQYLDSRKIEFQRLDNSILITDTNNNVIEIIESS